MVSCLKKKNSHDETSKTETRKEGKREGGKEEGGGKREVMTGRTGRWIRNERKTERKRE